MSGYFAAMDEAGLDPERTRIRHGVIASAACPWCGAKVGDPCVVQWTGEPLRDERTPGAVHPSRYALAHKRAA